MRFWFFAIAILMNGMMPGLRAHADAGDDQYAVAANHYAQGRWDLADSAFALFIDQHPDHARATAALYYWGEVSLQRKRYDDAGRRFKAFNDRIEKQSGSHPLAADGLFRQGESAYLAGDTTQATTLLDAYLSKFPKHASADHAMATLANMALAVAETSRQAADFQAAKARYVEALRRFPNGSLAVSFKFGLARAEDHLSEFKQADRHYSELLTAQPRSIAQQAMYFLGVLRYRQKDYVGASVPLDRLATESPESSWAIASLGHLAVCQTYDGKIAKAKETFQQWQASRAGQALDPSIVAALARAAEQQSDGDWPERLYARLAETKRAPQFARQGLAGLAQRQYEAGRLAEAVDTFGRLADAQAEPKVASAALMVRATILERLHRAADAQSVYLDLARRYPQSQETSTALLQAARISEAAQDKTQAVDIYRKIFATAGATKDQIATARYRCAWALSDLGQREAADQQFELLDRDHRTSRYWPDAALRMARQAFDRQDYKEAGRRLAKLIQAKPENRIRDHAYFLQARVAQAVDGWLAMEPFLENLVTEIPDSPLRLESEYWLAESAYQRGEVTLAGKRFEALQSQIEGRDEPWVGMVSLRRAQLRAKAKNWSDARSLAEALLASRPDFQRRDEAYYLIGRSLAAEARFDEARAAYLKAAPRDGSPKTETAAMAQWMIGESYLHQKKYRPAIEAYFRTEALYAYPRWQAAALLQAATCYEQLGESDQAEKLYRQIAQKYPETLFAQKASRRLQDTRPQGDTSLQLQ